MCLNESQSLLNEVKFPTKVTGRRMVLPLRRSQSLLNEVKFPTIPWVSKKKLGGVRSQSLLNEVKFPTALREIIVERRPFVAIPFK